MYLAYNLGTVGQAVGTIAKVKKHLSFGEFKTPSGRKYKGFKFFTKW